MKFVLVALVAFLFALPVSAAELTESWSRTSPSSGSQIRLITTGGLGDHTKSFACGSNNDCSMTLQGSGTVEIYWQTGPAGVYPTDFQSIGVTIAAGDRVLDLVKGRTYRAVFTVAGTATLIVSGN